MQPFDLSAYLWPEAENQRQPQGYAELARDEPLCKDLVFAFEASQGIVDLATRKLGEAQGSGVTLGTGPFGRQFNFSGSQPSRSCSFGTHQALLGAKEATWDILIYFAAGNASTHFYGQWDSGNLWLLQNNYGSLIWVAADDNGGTRRRWDASNILTAAGWYRIIASWQGGANKFLLVNGVDRTSALAETNVGATAIGTLNTADYLQVGKVSGGSSLNGAVTFARAWKRGLTAAECYTLHNSPWKIFAGPSIPFSVESSIAAGATLEGNAQAQASASGNLILAATLDGAALVVAGAGGNLTTQIPLAAASVAVVSATGELLTGIPLSGAALAQAIAAGTLTAQIRLDGVALAQAAAQAGLTSAILLAGNAQGQAGAVGTLAADPGGLAGAAQATASAVATLTTRIQLSGSAAAQAGVAGILTTAIPLAADALARAIATGTLSVPILLAGSAAALATATGVLSDVAAPAPTVAYRLTATVQRLARLSCGAAPLAQLDAGVRRLTTITHRVSHV